MERRIDRMNWRDIKKAMRKTDKVILPVGTLEAHSITANGTDTFIPERIAERVAENINALVLPPLHYGVTTSLLPYPGSVNISEKTLYDTILDIALSCKKDSFKHFIIINGHGGNNAAVDSVKKDIYLKTGMFVYAIHWWIFAYPICRDIFNSEGGHGGVDETAMIKVIGSSFVNEKYINEKNLYYEAKEGVSSIPSPATAIIYSKNGGKINLNSKLCLKYHDTVIKQLSEHLLEMFCSIDINLS